ncbi:MAG: DUF6115 domain-containing protein [Treponema sp.]
MFVTSIVLLIINILLMFFFFFKMKKQFSVEAYEALMRERVRPILMDFNLQIDQAITILEDKMNELKGLISDADGRFNALSRKIEAMDKVQILEKNAFPAKTNEQIVQPIVNNVVKEDEVVIYSGREDFAKKDELNRRRIVEMSKSGWSNEYIAQELSIPLAEVELILFMENRG